MKKVTPVLLSSLAIMLGACSSSDSDSDNDNPTKPVPEISAGKEVVIDASQSTVYFNLISGTEVAKAEDWHLSFDRQTVLVSDQARSGIAHEKNEFYNGGNPASSQQPVADNGQQFVNATNNNQLPSLLGAKKIIGDWISAGTQPAIFDWYSYNRTNHVLEPTDAYFVIRSNTGDTYAKATVSELNNTSGQLTLKFQRQGAADNTFQTQEFTWEPSFNTVGETCYDFDDNKEIADCSSGWDLKLKVVAQGPAQIPTFYTNGGVSGEGDGAAYKMDDPNEYNSGRGTGAPTDTNAIPPMAYEQDKPAGAFTSYSWYAYDPLNDGTHQLLPNYRVYVVDTQTPISTIEDGWYTPAHPLQANGQAYILRSGEGNSFAKMTFKEADTSYNLTFNFEVQSSSDSSFNTTAIEWNTDLQDSQCFDFDSGAKTSCDNATWDIKLTSEGRSITLTTNGGLNSTGGNAAIYMVPSSETPTGVDTNDQPEWQMLEPYKLQITDYYNDSGASGHISLRYMPLSQTTANNQ